MMFFPLPKEANIQAARKASLTAGRPWFKLHFHESLRLRTSPVKRIKPPTEHNDYKKLNEIMHIKCLA